MKKNFFAQKSKKPIFAYFWALFALNPGNENFPKYGICTESQPTIIRFILGHVKQNLMTQFCTKVQKGHFCLFFRPFCPKSREREFSQISDLHRKLANHNTLHFRTFQAKYNDSILHKSPKSQFLPIFGPFLP